MKSLFNDFNNSKYAAYDRPLSTEDMEVEAASESTKALINYFVQEYGATIPQECSC